MRYNKFVQAILLLLGVVLALLTNLATQAVPGWLQPYLFLAWPFLAVVFPLDVYLNFLATDLVNASDPPQPAPTSRITNEEKQNFVVFTISLGLIAAFNTVFFVYLIQNRTIVFATQITLVTIALISYHSFLRFYYARLPRSLSKRPSEPFLRFVLNDLIFSGQHTSATIGGFILIYLTISVLILNWGLFATLIVIGFLIAVTVWLIAYQPEFLLPLKELQDLLKARLFGTFPQRWETPIRRTLQEQGYIRSKDFRKDEPGSTIYASGSILKMYAAEYGLAENLTIIIEHEYSTYHPIKSVKNNFKVELDYSQKVTSVNTIVILCKKEYEKKEPWKKK